MDLIYLDPPFNSDADYNMLYSVSRSGAQYRAFRDTWTWDEVADQRFRDYQNAPGRPAYRAIMGLGSILGESGMLAYLTYMAERLEQMHRLLQPTGSIYLHCDPTASHGLKIVMDAIFGPRNFRNEITWQRTESHNTADRYGNVADILLYYKKAGGQRGTVASTLTKTVPASVRLSSSAIAIKIRTDGTTGSTTSRLPDRTVTLENSTGEGRYLPLRAGGAIGSNS